jgi:hypothetical protein
MHDEAADLSLILDDVLGPDLPPPPAPPSARPPESAALRELMDWVSNEVFGPA